MGTTERFRDIHQALERLRDSASTGADADEHLRRALKQLGKAAADFGAQPPPPHRDPPDDDVFRDDPPPPPPRTDLYNAPVHRIDPVRPGGYHATYEEGQSKSLKDVYFELRMDMPAREQVIIGVKGNTGSFGVGSSNGLWGTEEKPIDLALVALDRDSTVGPFGAAFGGSDVPVKSFHCYGLGIRGNPDSFVLRQGGPIAGDVVFSDFWMEPYQDGFVHTSGLHLQRGWGSLTLQRYQPRDTRFSEHIFYLKGGGPLQILDCELMGGNRTGFQIRPHGAGFINYPFHATPRPTGHVIIDGNHADGYGHDHTNPSGGAWLTVWTSVEYPVVVRNNRLTNGRYGGLIFSRQPSNVNPYYMRDGFGHSLAWIEGNDLSVNGDRSACKVSDSREVYFAGRNVFHADNRHDLIIDSDWAWKMGAQPNGRVHFIDRGSIPIADQIMQWSPQFQAYLPFNTADAIVALNL